LIWGLWAVKTEEGFDQTLQVNIDAVKYAAENPTVKTICVKISGFGRFELFEKKQKQGFETEAEKMEFDRILNRLDLLCQAGITNDLMRKYNRDSPSVMNTYQMYRHDRLPYLKEMVELAEKEGFILGAKLVRGAYVEKEREMARSDNRPDPIHKTKDAVDKDYDAAIDLCLENIERVSVSIASHNEASNMHAVNRMAELGIARNHPHVWFSQLYGMGDHISLNLAAYGVNATKYIPYGPVKKVIPYLIRRADENSSVEGQMSRELRLLEKELRRRKSLR
jgi:proline dehydrogenase